MSDDPSYQIKPFRVFISYRRNDSVDSEEGLGVAKKLRDYLVSQLGVHVFLDTENIRGGDYFESVLTTELSQCKCLVAIVGHHWLRPHPQSSEPDWVCREIEQAIHQGTYILPVLINGAKMPGADKVPNEIATFTICNAVDLSMFDRDAVAVADALLRIIQKFEMLDQTVRLNRMDTFTARTSEMNQIRNLLDNHKSVLLYGMGGLGKSELAIEFAFRNAYRQDFIFMARASTEEELSIDCLRISTLLSRYLNLPIVNDQASTVADSSSSISTLLSLTMHLTTWIMIIDGVTKNDMPDILAKHFGQLPSGHLIVTSRFSRIDDLAEPLKVGPMSDYDGAVLLLSRSHILKSAADLPQASEKIVADARRISRQLGGLPLALDQAGAAISQGKGIYPGEYLTRYVENTLAPSMRRDGRSKDARYRNTIRRTITLSLQMMYEFGLAHIDVPEKRDEAKACLSAIELMRIYSVLAPDPLPVTMLFEGASYLGEPFQSMSRIELHSMIDEAAAWAIVNKERDGATVRAHKIVWDVLNDINGDAANIRDAALEESAHPAANQLFERTLMKDSEALLNTQERARNAVEATMPDLDVTSKIEEFRAFYPHAKHAVGLLTEKRRAELHQTTKYNLLDVEADLGIQDALNNGNGWENLFGIPDVTFYRLLHALERPFYQKRLRRIIAALRQVQGQENARLLFSGMYLLAHYWWDCYLDIAGLCPDLLRIWENSNDDATPQDWGFDEQLTTLLAQFDAYYPKQCNYERRSERLNDWEKAKMSIVSLRELLGLTDRLTSADKPMTRYVKAITNIYLSETISYSDGWGSLPVVNDLYTEADDLLKKNQDNFHESWLCAERAGTWLEYSGNTPDTKASTLYVNMATDQAREAIKWVLKNFKDDYCEEEDEDFIDSELAAVSYRILADSKARSSNDVAEVYLLHASSLCCALMFLYTDYDLYSYRFYQEQCERMEKQWEEHEGASRIADQGIPNLDVAVGAIFHLWQKIPDSNPKSLESIIPPLPSKRERPSLSVSPGDDGNKMSSFRAAIEQFFLDLPRSIAELSSSVTFPERFSTLAECFAKVAKLKRQRREEN